MSRIYETFTIPSIALISEYAKRTEMDINQWFEYENMYYKYKKLENKRMSCIRLNDDELEEHQRLGRELEELVKKICQ